MHEQKMQIAINEAMIAFQKGEVPVGAAIFIGNKLIASAHNLKESTKHATAHAEMLAINKACEYIGDWRLSEASLYVTAEPCIMCSGAIMQARIKEVFYGVREPKFGGVVSCAQIFDIKNLNHKVTYTEGVCKEAISAIMKKFFAILRLTK